MMEYDTENMNSEEIYSSLRGVTEAIQSFSYRSQEDLNEPIRQEGKRDDAVSHNGFSNCSRHVDFSSNHNDINPLLFFPPLSSLTGRKRRRGVLSRLWRPSGFGHGGRRSHRLRQQDVTTQHAVASLVLWATRPRVRALRLRRHNLHVRQERPEGGRLRRWRGAVPWLWVNLLVDGGFVSLIDLSVVFRSSGTK